MAPAPNQDMDDMIHHIFEKCFSDSATIGMPKVPDVKPPALQKVWFANMLGAYYNMRCYLRDVREQP